MTKFFEGKLIRFEHNGVGVVDVNEIDEYVYFTPKQIKDYTGQTVVELKSSRYGKWVTGKTVLIQADVGVAGNVHVQSVSLKP